MVTSIQLGNFYQANGRTVLGGSGGSGLDTKSIIDSLVTAKQQPQTKLKDQVTLNDKKTAALTELQTLMGTFKDAANFLRNPPGVSNATNNLFQYTKTNVSTNTGAAASGYATVTSSPGATLQDYTINSITSIAAAKKQTTNAFNIANADTAVVSATPATGQFGVGTITIKGKNITLAAGDTLNAVASKFNAVSNDTGISATVVQVSNGSYQLNFSAKTTGLDANFDLGDPLDPTANSVTDPSGVLNQVTFDTTQDASNAVFKLDNITITRQTNNVSDVISGVTFSLVQPTPTSPATSLNISITADTGLVQNGIVNFANAYNALKTFYTKQTLYGDNSTPDANAVLINDQPLRSLMAEVNTQLNSIVSSLTNGGLSLADAGITFEDVPASGDTPKIPNSMNVNTDKLAQALSTNYQKMLDLFGSNFSSDNANLKLFSTSNAMTVKDFTLNLQFARSKTQESSVFSIADPNQSVVAATSTAGNFTAGTVTVKGVDIILAAGDTLAQVVEKFNNEKAQTGIEASIKEVSAGQYAISFATTVAGTSAPDFDLSNAGTVTDTSGVFSNITFATTQTAVDASYKAGYTIGGTPMTVDIDATPISGGGYTFTGKTGTALAGLVMVYGGDADATINASLSQGIADRLYNTATTALKDGTGSIAMDMTAIKNNTTKINDDIKRMDSDIEVYRNQLLDKYAALEKAISQVNTLLASLDANDKARNSNS